MYMISFCLLLLVVVSFSTTTTTTVTAASNNYVTAAAASVEADGTIHTSGNHTTVPVRITCTTA